MKINSIKLYNFGSYENLNIIDTNVSKSNNIILFGGKNGAGKTTLFTAIRLCLYGHTSLGYNTINSRYLNKIKSFMNNKALMNGENEIYVEIQLGLENGREIDNYVLIRKWTLDKLPKEDFIVLKNGSRLEQQQIADFEKYIFSIIPPELFNLYFFDGEKITDFFIEEDGNKKLKQAFLTLCGYDTFEIMLKNFKRNINSSEKDSVQYQKYLELKEKTERINLNIEEHKNKQKELFDELDDCDAELIKVDNQFHNSDNITDSEWKNLENQILQEETKREEWNYSIKKWANDTIPFVMLKKQIAKLKKQILNEKEQDSIDGFIEILESKEISNYLSSIKSNKNIKDELIELIGKKRNENKKILDYSLEQSMSVMSLISTISNFDDRLIYSYKTEIKESIAKTTKIKKRMDKISSTGSNEYIKTKTEILNHKEELLNEKNLVEQELNNLLFEYSQIKVEFEKSQSIVEEAIKKESVNDISIKAAMMLEKLQRILFKEQINKLEDNFKINTALLMNKKDLISDISIDDDFKLHVYQDITISADKIAKIFKSNDVNFDYIIGQKTKEAITKITKSKKDDINSALDILGKKKIEIPVEINFERLSAGERQMFIMSLYISLVQLGNIEIPFIIDTPFARIDLEHRENISKYFFNKLNGQVFILSTNKEIDNNHIEIIKDKLSKIYTLKNVNKSKTEIITNSYFGEKYDI